jgi:DNA-binding NtrC family response regulator
MATILLIDDEPGITQVFATFFERGGHTVQRAHTGEEGIGLSRRLHPDLVLLDVRLPDMTGFDVLERIREDGGVVVMVTGHGDVPMAVEAMQKGAENFLTKPVDLPHLAVVVDRALETVRLRRLNRYLAARRGTSARTLLGGSPAIREIADQIDLLSVSERTTVLILGESGSGKGRLAELIHRQSPRASGPYVEVNCAALTADSLDSELFGEEHADAGGRTRAGLFEVADGGTLFLDEIGDLDPALQPKLLRVLEGKSFRRVGGTPEITVDVRLVAATAKDLVNEVTAGNFREDLYYRLSVMPVHLPPLRARAKEDLVELIGHVLDELHAGLPDSPGGLTDGALDRLLKYGWPGNIRELRNVLERALIVGRGSPRVAVEHLPPEVRDASGLGVEHHVPRTLEEVERAHIERTLRAHNANRTHAARELGISRATLIKKIREYGLHVRPARPEPLATRLGSR